MVTTDIVRRRPRSDEWELGTWFLVRWRGRSTTQRASGMIGNTYIGVDCRGIRRSCPRHCCRRARQLTDHREISTSTLHSDHLYHYITITSTTSKLLALLLLLLLLFYYHYLLLLLLPPLYSRTCTRCSVSCWIADRGKFPRENLEKCREEYGDLRKFNWI